MKAILIIAAGSSSRLGHPKQLLPYRGSFLLYYIIEECIASQQGDVFVVLGANAALIKPKLDSLACQLIDSPNWEEGMGNSIASGVKYIGDLGYEGVFIVLTDQPFFTRNLLLEISRLNKESTAAVILSKYKKGMGPPAYFDACLFEELIALDGDIGAKPVVQKHLDKVAFIDFEKGNLDVDVESDLDLLR